MEEIRTYQSYTVSPSRMFQVDRRGRCDKRFRRGVNGSCPSRALMIWIVGNSRVPETRKGIVKSRERNWSLE